MRRQRGFTLVELVIVIVLISVISLASVQFISNLALGYADQTRRQNLSDVTQLAVERISRELRNALPNSVRVRSLSNDSCIEFIPIHGASTYQNLPVGTASNQLTVLPLGNNGLTSVSGSDPLFIAVYPIDSNTSDENHGANNPVYDMDNHSIVARVANSGTFIGQINGSSVASVTLRAAHRFPTESPIGRFYIVGLPVSYCLLSNGDLYRYNGYFDPGAGAGTADDVFYAQQQMPSSGNLGSSEPGRVLMAAGIDAPEDSSGNRLPFASYVNTNLQRNGLVLFDLQVEETAISRNSESVRIQHAVQVRNAP